jgi:hypothetical protein
MRLVRCSVQQCKEGRQEVRGEEVCACLIAVRSVHRGVVSDFVGDAAKSSVKVLVLCIFDYSINVESEAEYIWIQCNVSVQATNQLTKCISIGIRTGF